METITIFVYGTLKRGYWNNTFLKDSKFIGEAVSIGNYDMYGVGIPHVVKNSEGIPVSGEIYEINRDTLEDIDMLESNGSMYTRQKEQFKVNNEIVTAWIYLSNTPHEFYVPNPKYAKTNGILKYEGG